jgi:two-component system, OmpR family, heavy metal sensor histidine kinase CusS
MPDTPLQRRAVSLTWRLVTGYTAAAFLTLSTAAFVLYHELKKGFEIEDAELLSDNVSAIRGAVRADPEKMAEAFKLIDSLAAEWALEKYYGRLLDAQGRVLIKTPGMESFSPPPDQFPAPAPPDQSLLRMAYGTSLKGGPAFLVAAEVPRGGGREMLTYQVALDSSHVAARLKTYRISLVVVVAVASAATALLGWMITRRGLRPLKEITATAQRITATGLDEHIRGNAWPEELALLAVEFDRMLARLRESFERLSQFTADAAHEFRTPLNNLLGGTSLALARPRSADDYRSLLEANVEEYHRLSHMMDSLLFLARADNAQTTVKRKEIDVSNAVAEVIDFFSALAEEHGIDFKCTCSGSVTADPTLLRMALTNLVSNALRHSPPGATVTIAAEERPGGMLVSVRDEGAGIAAEHLPRVFDRFYRAEESRTNLSENTGGSGLGLALVKTIMNLHGGTATVESTAGRGTTFLLHFSALP